MFLVCFSSFIFILKMKKIHLLKHFFHRHFSAGTNPLVWLCHAAQHGISSTVSGAPSAKPGQGQCCRNNSPTTAAQLPLVCRSSGGSSQLWSLCAFKSELLLCFHFARCLSVFLFPCQEDRVKTFFTVRSRLPFQTYRGEEKP